MSKNKIIVLIVLIFFIIPLVSYGVYLYFHKSDNFSENKVTIITSQDTGEQVTSDPNLTPEKVSGQTVSILGLSELIDDNILTPQLNFIKRSISSYADNQLNSRFSIITIIPTSYINNNGIITAKLRLGQNDDFVDINITALDSGKTQVIILDPGNKYGGNYDSGAIQIYAD